MEKFKVYFAEFLGTMLLVGMGTGVLAFNQQGGLIAVGLAFGLAAMAGVYAFGSISGAHLNPAISLGMAINKRISWMDFLGYFGAQLLGGLAASGMVFGVFASINGFKLEVAKSMQLPLGQTTYQPEAFSALSAGVIEAVLTFFLVLVVMMVTSKKANAGLATGLVIGLTLAALIFVGGNLTGASLNTARSFGPAMVEAMIGNVTALGQMGVYLVGPLAGGALAAVVAKLFGSEEA